MSDDPRLEQVEKDIAAAREEAEDAGILDDDDQQKFYESGDMSKGEDDQQIAPPG
jgi:hypothetical protein